MEEEANEKRGRRGKRMTSSESNSSSKRRRESEIESDEELSNGEERLRGSQEHKVSVKHDVTVTGSKGKGQPLEATRVGKRREGKQWRKRVTVADSVSRVRRRRKGGKTLSSSTSGKVKHQKTLTFRESTSEESGLSNERGQSSSSQRTGRKTATVREVRVTEREVETWQPISANAIRVLSDAMTGAFGHCLEGVSGAQRREVERQMQVLMARVKERLASTKAPMRKRVKSYSGVKSKVEELKRKYLSLIERNQQLQTRLEERTLLVEDKEEKTEQLLEALQHSSSAPPLQDMPEPPQANCSADEYLDGMVKFFETSRTAASCSTSATV